MNAKEMINFLDSLLPPFHLFTFTHYQAFDIAKSDKEDRGRYRNNGDYISGVVKVTPAHHNPEANTIRFAPCSVKVFAQDSEGKATER